MTVTNRNEPFQPQVAKSQSEIDDFCEHARREGRFAFDTEFVMEDRYEPEVCLVQLAGAKQVLLIDPFSKLDISPVWNLICEPGVETIVHAGQEDLALCVQHTGRLPANIFDVQIAAGLVGYDYPISLQKLVQATLHVRLHKSKTLTDWRRRPLSESQLLYGAEDVGYLIAARDKLYQRLERKHRTPWAREEFSIFEDMTYYRRVEEEKVRHLKGTRGMAAQKLAVVRDLLHWRDEMAQKMNRPARVMLKDHLLVEIARFGMTSAAEIRDLRGLNLSDRNMDDVARVVKKALESPSKDWPQAIPHDVESQSDSTLIALSTAVIRGYCMEHDLAYSLAATKNMIRELIRYRERTAPGVAISASQADEAGHDNVQIGESGIDSPAEPSDAMPELLQGWRGQTIGAMLDDVLAGRRAIRVDTSGAEIAIRVTE